VVAGGDPQREGAEGAHLGAVKVNAPDFPSLEELGRGREDLSFLVKY